jgi:TonB family protein
MSIRGKCSRAAIALIGVLWFSIGAAAEDAAPPPVSAPNPAPASAKFTPPKFLSGPEPIFPDAAKAAGEHGKVVVSGTIDVDGRLHDPKVDVSSKSELLDASALAAATAAVFEPARDEHGVAIAKHAQVPYDFSNARTAGKGGGALRYRCDQFVRDYDWWYKTWPADQHDDFYLMVLGYDSLIALRSGNLGDIAESNKNFESHWRATIEDCRKSPDKLFVDVIEPEGPFLRRLAGG